MFVSHFSLFLFYLYILSRAQRLSGSSGHQVRSPKTKGRTSVHSLGIKDLRRQRKLVRE